MKIKTFKDLEFKDHPYAGGSMFGSFGKMSRLAFPNGYGVSVITGGSGTYSDDSSPYELAVLKDNALCYDTHLTDDVIGHCTESEVTKLMKQVQAL